MKTLHEHTSLTHFLSHLTPTDTGAMSDGSDDGETVLMAMSTLQEEGVMSVKQVACDRLLNFRVEAKVAGRCETVPEVTSIQVRWMGRLFHLCNL
jgi:hypothetical protein